MESAQAKKLLAMVGFGALTAGAAAVGARFAPDAWYRKLKKPWFQPPDWVFAPVWTGLYTLIAVSGYRVWNTKPSSDRTKALTLWGAQLGLNAAWTWLFFGKHDPKAALVEIGVLRASINAYSRAAQKVDPSAPLLMAPYQGWVTYAALLNADIARKNT